MRDLPDSASPKPRLGLLSLGGLISGRTWVVAGAFSVVTALVIGIPTRVVPNGFFRRMTPTRPLDYAFLAVASGLVGLTLALRPRRPVEGSGKVFAGGLATVLAVGCPICNKVVVTLIGTAGALSVFAPIQPALGAAGIALLIVGLRRRLRDLRATTCPVSAGVAVAPKSTRA